MANSGSHAPSGSRPPKPHEVVSRKGMLRRWGRLLMGSVFKRRAWHDLQLILGGAVFFQTLRTACDLDLFGLLRKKQGLTLEEIAEELEIGEYPARVLLMTCVALKLVRKVGSRYRCSSIFTRRLDRKHPQSLLPILEWMHHIVYPSMFHYAQAVQECRPAGLQVFKGDEDDLYGRLAHDSHLQRVFYEALQARSRLTNPEFLDRVDFSKFRRILDVGGGDGEIMLAIAERHPSVQGTLFDLPSVAEMAARHFAERGMDDRLKASGGNLFEEDFPGGQDCVLFCHFLPIFSEKTNRSLMKRAYEALEPGGMVCVYGRFMNDRETGPLQSAMLSPYILCTVSGEGRHYSWQETSSWLQEAGFVEITRVGLVLDEGVLLGSKP